MTSDEARHVPDRAFRVAQPSPPLELLYIACSHKGPRSGGRFRGGLPMLCPGCWKERKNDKAA
jgi:hypothetical protein